MDFKKWTNKRTGEREARVVLEYKVTKKDAAKIVAEQMVAQSTVPGDWETMVLLGGENRRSVSVLIRTGIAGVRHRERERDDWIMGFDFTRQDEKRLYAIAEQKVLKAFPELAEAA
jgi:hypothetical protein